MTSKFEVGSLVRISIRGRRDVIHDAYNGLVCEVLEPCHDTSNYTFTPDHCVYLQPLTSRPYNLGFAPFNWDKATLDLIPKDEAEQLRIEIELQK